MEEEFEAHWERWLDQADEWKPFFLELERLKETDLKTALQSFDLITDEEFRTVLTICAARLKGAQCHCLLRSLPQTRTSHPLRLDLRVVSPARSPFHTRDWTTHEGAGPVPRRFVVHSH